MAEVLDWRKCSSAACSRRVGGGAAFCCRACHHAALYNEETSNHSPVCEHWADQCGPWDPVRDSPS